MKTSTKLYLSLALFLACNTIFAQDVKVVDTPDGTVISNMGGTDIPYSASILDIRSTNKGILLPRMSTGNRDAISAPQAGLLIYNNTTNQFNYHNGSSWQVASLGNQWGVNGSILHHSGQVGIGTSTMTNAYTFLNVKGNQGGTSYEGMYITSSSTKGRPFYGYSANDSTTAFHYYDGNNSRWNLNVGNADRVTVTNTGNVGIGTNLPLYRLHVNGSTNITGTTYIGGSTYISGNASVTGQSEVFGDSYVNGIFDVDLDGYINRDAIVGRNLDVTGTSALDGNVTMGNNATVDGTLTVNNGKGVLYNTHGSAQLKYYTREAAFTAILAGEALSTEGSVGLGGGFTSPPSVMVGNIVSTGGTSGQLYRVQLILYDCTTTSCKARLLNTSPNSVNYDVTWNIICIGN